MPLFIDWFTEIVVSHATVFLFLYICHHASLLQHCVAAQKQNGCVVDPKTTVQKSITEKSCTRTDTYLPANISAFIDLNMLPHKGKHESII